ncbi:MAG: hypothetical protein ACFFDY_14970 [Candidatus Thorarchaeota archaeon]
MDITQFNKELATKIAIAKRFEKKGDIQAAIQEWMEISEMAINFSKSPKLDVSFKNMIITRTQGIFLHIKELKASKSQEEIYEYDLKYLEEEPESGMSPEKGIVEDIFTQEEQENQKSIMDSTEIKKSKIIEDSDLPKGFKEIQPSEDFTIITPHDEDFVKKQRAIAEQSDYFKSPKQSSSEEDAEPPDRIDLEQPKDGKSLICFACGYDKNEPNAKVCKNCGIKLN